MGPSAAATVGHLKPCWVLAGWGCAVVEMEGELYAAARTGNVAEARRLAVEFMNNTRCSGETPLHAAAQGGHVEMITTLVQLGANMNVQDTDGRSPLYVAEQAEVIKLVELGPFYLWVGGVEVGHDGGVVPALPQGRSDGLARHNGTRALTHVQHALLRHQLPDEVAEPRLLQMVQQPEGIAACCATLSRPTHLEPLT